MTDFVRFGFIVLTNLMQLFQVTNVREIHDEWLCFLLELNQLFKGIDQWEKRWVENGSIR